MQRFAKIIISFVEIFCLILQDNLTKNISYKFQPQKFGLVLLLPFRAYYTKKQTTLTKLFDHNAVHSNLDLHTKNIGRIECKNHSLG